MPDSYNNEKKIESQRPSRKKTAWTFVVIALVLLLTVASVWFLLYQSSRSTKQTPGPAEVAAPSLSPPPSSGPPGAPGQPAPAETTGNKVADNAQPLTTTPPLAMHPGEAGTPSASGNKLPAQLPPEQQCLELSQNLANFFSYLDEQEYVREFVTTGSSQQYFLKLAQQLLDSPPVVVHETDDIYTIVKNMAHFFRVAGGKNLKFIKMILEQESAQLEDLASWLYQWTMAGSCPEQKNFPLITPLDKMYNYAGFFLHTIGGRSYLFRRDSRCRLLISYYCVLLIDQANSAKLNTYGLTINQIIPQLTQEIESSTSLKYKENYLDKLYELQERYP